MATLIRCIAIDDEPFALQMIADDLKKFSFVELKGIFANPSDAVALLKTGEIDLMFLDIQMPTLNGIQFLKGLENPPMVIFTTAFEQYALDGYELNVVDYLLKPYPFVRLQKATQKAFDLWQLKQQSSAPKERGFFVVYAEYKQVKIYFDEITYIEGLKDYVKIYVNFQLKPILTRLNLKGIESKLPMEQFCRVHLSFIVALDKITSFVKYKLLIGKTEIPIGKKFLESFEQKYIS
ncbi:MAG: LytTR family DNA-binding domain-containing protein [Spirosomataceae bacterium]